MKSYRPHFQNKSTLLIYAILILFSTMASFLVVKNIIISTDSIIYGLISQQIIAGNGIRIPVIGLIEFDNMVPIDGTVPYFTQPPLLPIVLAILGGVTSQTFLAAQILNAICHTAISIFTFLLMKKFCSRGIALVTGIITSISLPLLNVAHHITTETLFIALTVSAIYFLILSRHSNHASSCWNLIIASLCASASILTRYAGIVFLGVFFWEALISIKNKRIASQFKSVILAISIPVITVVALFTRNYINAGMIRGLDLPTPERSYLEAFTGMIKMIFLQFQLGTYSIIIIIFFLIVSVIYIVLNTNMRKELFKHFQSGLDLILIFIISYSALIFITLAKDQPHFELRYVTPLVPFLFIASIFVIVSIWEDIKVRGFHKLSLCGLILSLVIITAANCYKTFLNMPEFSYKQKRGYSILHSCAYKWVKENYGNDIIIATNKPFRLSFFGGYSTLVLPNRKWIPNARIPDNMKHALPNRMSEVGSQVIVLFDEIKEQHYGNYVAKLSNEKKDNGQFMFVHKCSDGVVYVLKE